MYNPVTDFLGLVRKVSGQASIAQIPGLDYIVAALVRAGMFRLFVGQEPPTVNQATTVWLKPSLPSWVAEGVVYLWDEAAGDYAIATPALWAMLLSPNGYLFQSVVTGNATILTGVSILAVQRAAPTETDLLLPNLDAQWLTGRPLKVVDWSTGVVAEHVITLTTPDGSSIMQHPSLQLFSNAVQSSSVTLHACPNLNGWVIAP